MRSHPRRWISRSPHQTDWSKRGTSASDPVASTSATCLSEHDADDFLPWHFARRRRRPGRLDDDARGWDARPIPGGAWQSSRFAPDGTAHGSWKARAVL
eukprot:g26289.t1